MPAFDITIPVYNEESALVAQITKVVNYIKNNLSRYNINFKLIIADNGSSDNTAVLAKQLANQYDIITYNRLNKPGIGLALKAAWLDSEADFIGYMDLDLSTDINHLHEAINFLVYQNYDIVYASRLLKNSKVIGRSLVRETTSRIFNKTLQLYFNTKITDAQCGFKFLKRNYLDSIINNGATNNSWFFPSELLIVAESLGLKLKAIPVKWIDDPNSKVRLLKLSCEYLKAMKALKHKLLKLKKI